MAVVSVLMWELSQGAWNSRSSFTTGLKDLSTGRACQVVSTGAFSTSSRELGLLVRIEASDTPE